MKEIDKIVELITDNVAEESKNDILNQVKSDAQLRKEYSSVKNAWALSESQVGMSELRIERAYLSLKTRVKKQRQTIQIRLYSFLKYAAILLIVFGAGVFSENYLIDKMGGWQTAKGKLTEFVVPSGQIAEVSLPDGSHVWLNAETRLSFSSNFTDKAREVTLKGEAYFKIQKGKIPFVVSTKFGEIEVLGTSFNVRAFENSEFQTTLVEGTIKYKNPEQYKEITLSPGQQLVLSKNNGIQVHEVKTDLYTSWKDGVIIFKKEPLRNVMQQLERHFAIRIQLEDDLLGEIRFTGSIKDESLFEVMEYIDKTEPIQYSYDKKQKLLIVKQK
ncbi:MAG: FecR family protein [Mangrovibacterium sp.]